MQKSKESCCDCRPFENPVETCQAFDIFPARKIISSTIEQIASI